MTESIEDKVAAQSLEIQKLHELLIAQDTASKGMLQQLNEEKIGIDRQVDAYALEIASRRGYERTVGFVLTVSAGIAVGLGVLFAFLGLDELDKIEAKVAEFDQNADVIEARLDSEITNFKTELDVTIDDKIALFFDRNEGKSDVYRENVDNMGKFVDVLAQAESRWEDIKPAIEGLEQYDPDADLKGDYLAIIEADQRAAPEEGGPTRAEEVGIVLRISRHLRRAEEDPGFTSQFTPSDIFNAAQIARRLQRADLENELVNAAYELDNTALSTRALFFQFQAQYGPQGEREARYFELLGFLDDLTMDSPHIVLAEAWNATEGKRRYTDLIDALERRIATVNADQSVLLPSHAFAVKGNAHQRRGTPGELQIAVESYVQAINRLALEGTHTQWWEATVRDTLQGVERLLIGGVDISPILEAAERSGIIPLQQNISQLILAIQLGASQTTGPVGDLEQMLQLFEQMEQSEP